MVCACVQLIIILPYMCTRLHYLGGCVLSAGQYGQMNKKCLSCVGGCPLQQDYDSLSGGRCKVTVKSS